MTKFDNDYLRFSKSQDNKFVKFLRIIKNYELRYLFYLRKEESSKSKIFQKIYHFLAYNLGKHYGLEMGSKSLGAGVKLAHAFNIHINKSAFIGENATIFKGVTVGSIRREGGKADCPKIGKRVTICANAMVCGKIIIGDDVLIAANSFVNFDVPGNSVVIGNPGVIHKKINPSKEYL